MWRCITSMSSGTRVGLRPGCSGGDVRTAVVISATPGIPASREIPEPSRNVTCTRGPYRDVSGCSAMSIDYQRESEAYRAGHPSTERTAKARMVIDSGFVHHRKIQALLGPHGVEIINAA